MFVLPAVVALLAMGMTARRPAGTASAPSHPMAEPSVAVPAVRPEGITRPLHTAPGLSAGLTAASNGAVPAAVAGSISFELPQRLAGLSEDLIIALRQQAELEPQTTLKFLDEHSRGEVRVRLLDEVLGIWADNAPADALVWLTEHNRQGEFSANVPAVLAAYAAASPAAAGRWLQQNRNEASLDNWRLVVNSWGGQDPVTMLNTLPTDLAPGFVQALLPDILVSLATPSLAADLLRSFPRPVADGALVAAHKALAEEPRQAQNLAAMITDKALRSAAQAWRSRDGGCQGSGRACGRKAFTQ